MRSEKPVQIGVLDRLRKKFSFLTLGRKPDNRPKRLISGASNTGTDSGAQGAAVTPRRKLMSIKSKVLAGAAALGVMAGGLGVAGAVTAQAATPSCGHRCVTLANPNTGGLVDVYKRTGKVGQKIILWSPSNYDPAEDFTIAAQGTVKQFYKAGLASSAFNLHYGSFEAFELQYAPYGAQSGLCVGVGTTAVNGTPITLQPCGNSSKTLWVFDAYSAKYSNGSWSAPLINGSDTNFSNPYVLTDNSNLVTEHLTKFSNGSVYSNQMWSLDKGIL
jgi:hypothetical protein